MTSPLETDVPAIQRELSTWSAAMRRISDLAARVEAVHSIVRECAPETTAIVRDLRDLRSLCGYWVNDLQGTLIDTIPAGIGACAGTLHDHALAVLNAIDGDRRGPVQASIVRELEDLSLELSRHLASARLAERRLQAFLIDLASQASAIAGSLDAAADAVGLDAARLDRMAAQLAILIDEESREIRRMDYVLRGEGDVGSDDIEPLFGSPITRGLARLRHFHGLGRYGSGPRTSLAGRRPDQEEKRHDRRTTGRRRPLVPISADPADRRRRPAGLRRFEPDRQHLVGL